MGNYDFILLYTRTYAYQYNVLTYIYLFTDDNTPDIKASKLVTVLSDIKIKNKDID